MPVKPVPRPAHLVPVALIALVLYLLGAADYLLTRFGVEGYLARLPPGLLAFTEALPLWVAGAWALGVWAGLVGALMLLWREDGAAIAFALSAIGFIGAGVHAFVLARPTLPDVVGAEAGYGIAGGAAVLAVLLWLYARAQKIAGVLT